MNKKKAKEIFEKYNPKDGVVRCHNGRAKMRKALDKYVKAAVNLYGIISRDEFVRIFNAQNIEQTSADELYTILLPNVLKSGWYGFYKDYIVHYIVLDNFDWVQYLEREQADKPRYIPAKEQFLEFEREDYDENDHWHNLLMFMFEIFGYRQGLNDVFLYIKDYTIHNGISRLGPILEKNNLVFENEEQANKFFKLLVVAKNDTRMWENKGHTPNELRKLFEDNHSNEYIIRKTEKLGPNQPCPCGSGKKYKKCCGQIEMSGAAILSRDEQKLFYDIWLKLLNYINQKMNIIDYTVNLTGPDRNNEAILYKIIEKLWENPKLISDFLCDDVSLSDEEGRILVSWEQKHIKGKFILMKYEPEYAVFMLITEDDPIKLYAVKGITNSIGDVVRNSLPTMVETVLLPFNDSIIYHSIMSFHSISFGEGIKDVFEKDYVKSKDKYGIINKL